MSENKYRFSGNALFILILCLFPLAPALSAEVQFVYDAKGKHNPFMPLVTPDGRIVKLEAEGDNAGLFLEGVIHDKDGLSYAILNGAIVKIGDEINGYRVLKIEKEKIILIKDGQTYQVEINKEGE